MTTQASSAVPNAKPASRKDLAVTKLATAYQKEHVRELQARVQSGEPYAIVNADTPHEIFHAMDIPIITNQWWSSYIAAKQLSSHYFDYLQSQGFRGNICRYCSLGLACSMDPDKSRAPWGGLPRPVVLTARLTCDCIQRVFSLWGKELDAPFFALEAPGWDKRDPRWFEKTRYEWDELYEPRRLDLMVEEMKALIRLLEARTGRQFRESRLAELMHKINEQEELLAEASRLACETVPCPVAITDQMPNTMIPQWHRGSDWAIQHSRAFVNEIRERVEQGHGVVANERVRMMWIGAGLWHDPGFYNALEVSHGAAFVWSMYLPFAGVAYPRYKLEDPLRALASRVAGMNEVLHLPPWMNEWMVSEAKRAKIDAALILVPKGSKLSVSGIKFTKHALEQAGVPVIDLWADMVDSREWSRDEIVGMVGKFLDERVGRKGA
jgi:benzoyl-CoA reductase subunit B